MNIRLVATKTVGSIVAATIVATIPLMVQAKDAQASSASTKTAESIEIADLKRQIYLCHHHKRHHRTCPVTQVIEKRVVVEKPVIVEREKIVEKQVFVDRPAVVETPVVVDKQVVVDRQVEMDQKVIVEHSKHRRHLLHMGIPFVAVTLF